jgi:hypothetical protein
VNGTVGASEPRSNRLECDTRRFFERIAVYTRTDGGKADGADAVPRRQIQASAVAAGKLFGLAVSSVTIDRTYRMKNKLRGKRSGVGDNRTSGWTPARLRPNLIQLPHDGWSTGAMDRTVDAASAAKSGISRVHDRVNRDPGNVADHQAELLAAREIDLHIAIVKVETIRRTGAF